MSVALLATGLLSHGFREDEDPPLRGYRRFHRQGREDRWVRETDGQLAIGTNLASWLICGSLNHPCSQIDLLLKCGQIWLRTREREGAREKPELRQKRLKIDAEEWLRELR